MRTVLRAAAAACVLVLLGAARARAGAASFLEEGLGARWLGLGGAARAAATDAHAGLWNPANLSDQGAVVWQAGSMLALGSLDRRTASLAGSWQTDAAGTYALAWVRRSTAGLERVDDQGNVAGEESAAEDALAVSGGWAPWYRVRAGATVKLLHQSLLGYAATGVAADLGLRIQPFLSTPLHLALTGENLAGRMAWDTGTTDTPDRGIGAGAAWRTGRDRLLLSADVVVRAGRSTPAVHAGAEFWPLALAAVRGGYDNGRLAAGASYRLKPYEFDYAFSFDPARLHTRHLLSFLLAF